jgi:membrane protein YdbS with pleckstrin-like domain
MVSSSHFSLNQPFKPAPALVIWLSVNFMLFFLLILSFTVFPILIASGFEPVVLAIISFIIIPVVVFFVWVGLYYKSIWYKLREDEMSWKRGVWFRTIGVVPYNRITNMMSGRRRSCGRLRIFTLAVQTAGYSGKAVPEIRIEGMEYAEELRELIHLLVRQSGTGGDGTRGTPSGSRQSRSQQTIRSLMNWLKSGSCSKYSENKKFISFLSVQQAPLPAVFLFSSGRSRTRQRRGG